MRWQTPSCLVRLCRALVLLAVALLCVSAAHAAAYDALVSKQPVAEGGTLAHLPRFATVSGALNAGYSDIAITSGDYYEKLVIARDGVSLSGVTAAHEKKPRIYFDAYAGRPAAIIATIGAHRVRQR